MRMNSVLAFSVFALSAAVAPAQTFTLLHVFHGPDGADPESASIVEDTAGNLYSTTAFGGASGFGALYTINQKTLKETVLHSFSNGTDGGNPFTGIASGADGKLYGTTLNGGANGFGTAFRSTTAGAFNTFYQFQGGSAAANPGRLITGPAALYGVAGGGAPIYAGMVYSLTPSGETDLYKFAGGADGSHASWIVRDNSGNLYGAAGGGDLACGPLGGCGVIFKIDSSGTYSVLHVFVGPDGSGPTGLVLDPAGNLYGTTGSGGAHNQGTVFELKPNGALTTLYAFTGGADGANPQSGVIRDNAGNLYGSASSGGNVTSQCSNLACGVIFMLSPAATATAWKETVLHSFTGADGDNPLGPLLLDSNRSALYGTTYRGGDFSCTTIAGGNSCGVVFRITP